MMIHLIQMNILNVLKKKTNLLIFILIKKIKILEIVTSLVQLVIMVEMEMKIIVLHVSQNSFLGQILLIQIIVF